MGCIVRLGWGEVGDPVACSSSTSSDAAGDDPLLPGDSGSKVGQPREEWMRDCISVTNSLSGMPIRVEERVVACRPRWLIPKLRRVNARSQSQCRLIGAYQHPRYRGRTHGDFQMFNAGFPPTRWIERAMYCIARRYES